MTPRTWILWCGRWLSYRMCPSLCHNLFPLSLRRQRSARQVLPEHAGDLGSEELEAAELLRFGESVGVGAEVDHLVAELLVVAAHLVDHLLRAAYQRRAAVDEVLDRLEYHRQPGAAREG